MAGLTENGGIQGATWKAAWETAKANGTADELRGEIAFLRAQAAVRRTAEMEEWAKTSNKCKRCGTAIPSHRRTLCPPCKAISDATRPRKH